MTIESKEHIHKTENSCSEDIQVLKGMALESNEHTQKTENTSRKHTYIILTPLNPNFNKTGVYRRLHYVFLLLLKYIDCGYSLEPPRQGGSNEYPQSMFLSRNMKTIRIFYPKTFSFWW